MKSFIALSVLLAVANAGVILKKPLVNSGHVSGPVHPVVGDIVSTRRGPVPLSLEGFSEDDNQDGFVDPIGQAVPVVPAVVPAVAPVTYKNTLVPVVASVPAVPHVKATEVKVEVPEVKVEKVEVAPVVYHHAAHAAPLTYTHYPVVPAVAPVPAVAKFEVPEVKVEKVEAKPVVYTHAVNAHHKTVVPVVASVPAVTKVDVPHVKVEKVEAAPVVPYVHTYSHAQAAVPIAHHTVTHHAPVFHHALPTFAHNTVFAHPQYVNPAVPFVAAAPGVVVENKPKVEAVAVEEA